MLPCGTRYEGGCREVHVASKCVVYSGDMEPQVVSTVGGKVV